MCSQQSIDLHTQNYFSFQTIKTSSPGLIQVVRKKTAGSHMTLRGNISVPVWITDLVEVSKDTASLVDCTRKKIFCWKCGFFVRDVISGRLFGHLGQLHLALDANR